MSALCWRGGKVRVCSDGELCSICAAQAEERNRLVEFFTAAALAGLAGRGEHSVEFLVQRAVEIGIATANRFENAAKAKP